MNETNPQSLFYELEASLKHAAYYLRYENLSHCDKHLMDYHTRRHQNSTLINKSNLNVNYLDKQFCSLFEEFHEKLQKSPHAPHYHNDCWHMGKFCWNHFGEFPNCPACAKAREKIEASYNKSRTIDKEIKITPVQNQQDPFAETKEVIVEPPMTLVEKAIASVFLLVVLSIGFAILSLPFLTVFKLSTQPNYSTKRINNIQGIELISPNQCLIRTKDSNIVTFEYEHLHIIEDPKASEPHCIQQLADDKIKKAFLYVSNKEWLNLNNEIRND